MNKYPLWRYLLILAVILLGLIYALPNLYGDDPAIQISALRTSKVNAETLARVEQALTQANYAHGPGELDEKGLKIRFTDTETQLKARDMVQAALGENYIVALNLLPATPRWLRALNANPMYLGLDLRGGVHFLMQVDMVGAIKKAASVTPQSVTRRTPSSARNWANWPRRMRSVAVNSSSARV
jgi:preprotein translocase subunit SecD